MLGFRVRILFINGGGTRWTLWAKVGAMGNAMRCPRQARRCGISRIVHKSTAPSRSVVLFCECMHSPSPQRAFELVRQHLGVHVLAFVAKPEQLPERTSHDARMGYDRRFS
jgi:hypothetical protein